MQPTNQLSIRSVDEIIRLSSKKNPNADVLSYRSYGEKYIDYTASELHQLVERASRKYTQTLPKSVIRTSSNSPKAVIGLVGPTGLQYIITFLALQRLGLTCLLLSTRLSHAAFLHLFKETKCNIVIADTSYSQKMTLAKQALEGELEIFPILTVDEVLNPSPVDISSPVPELDHAKESVEHGWIIHSSGSTGLPKPIGQSHRSALAAAISLGATSPCMVTLPLYHTFGMLVMLHSLACGHKAFFYPASTPVTGPGIVQELKATNAGILYTVPYALKIVSESEGGIEALQKLQAVVYIGSSCPQALGDRLVNAGVVLCSFYGSTECGFLLKYASLELWNWLQIVEDAKPYVMFEPRGENTFEMVVAKGWKSLVDSNRPDGSFATKDLLLRHPEFPNLYKYLQRSDDTIVLSNGEKTNPIFLENSIRQNRYVEAAIVFGAERPSLGVIVIPSSYAIGLSSEEIIENIWPDVTKGNDVSPAYARIYKDAILVKEPNALFPKTDKGTVIRPAFIKQFQADIDAYYARLDEVTEFTGEDLTEPEIRQLVRSIVAKELQIDETTLADDADFFNMSLDSLMAISARTKLSKLVNTRGVPLSSNIVFDRPNVTALTEHLFGLSTGNGEKEEVPVEERMAAMVKKYSTFKRHVFSNGSIRGDYVVLTGSTGSLGAQILSILVQRPKILGVYCFVRANDQSSAQSRVLDSLRQGQLLPTLSPSHLTKIHALPADLSAPDFGLPQETLDEVTTRVTTVIHSAWSVNFNSTLESFEKHHIRGTHNLLNLCLSTPRRLPATFSFISSISTSLNRGTPTIPESLPDFSHAMNMGYGQSKLVAEHIVATADKKPSMMTRILRVGQIVGDTKHGQWNPKEATPLTVQSARTIGALPVIANGDEALSWLPLDVTANTVVDLALADTPSKQRVFNVCHPKVLYWNRDFLPALKEAGLDFEAVEQHEWLRRLEASEQNGEKNPSIKLLGFFQNKYSGDAAVQEPYFETTETCKCSKSLREAKEVDSALIKKFVRFWQEECW